MAEDYDDLTLPSVKEPSFLTPVEPKPFVLLSELSGKPQKQPPKTLDIESFPLPELKPLSFTVAHDFFDLEDELWGKNVNHLIEHRGLLQLIEERIRKTYIRLPEDEESEEFVINLNRTKSFEWKDYKHIGLQFPAKKGFVPAGILHKEYDERRDLAKTRIEFEKIESVSFKQGILKGKIIIKLKPEQRIHRLAIDKIDREIVLIVARKDFSLAKQYVTAILSQVSELQLRKTLG